MHSIRTKIIMLAVTAIVITITLTTVLGAIGIRNLGNNSSEQLLSLLCQTGKKNLDSYFDSIEQSVKVVSSFAKDDLETLSLDNLDAHIIRVQALFEKMANNTAGILTYYYRIDPEVSKTEKGFWYIKTRFAGFYQHEVTDITQYDTTDQTKLVWFSVPKATGKSIWMQPYFTENLGEYVFSYNTPVYKDGRFIGVIGIELDYFTIANDVNSITLYENGYAFINNSDGDIIYHPNMDTSELTGENKPKVPEGLVSNDKFVRYTYNGVKKLATWLRLDNGMRLYVTVPVSEISRQWQKLVNEAIIVSILLLVLFTFTTIRLSKHITEPLKRLTTCALEVDKGNYDVELTYNGKGEVGILTRTFKQLTAHLKEHIADLNNLVYSDALTSVRNKGAFDVYVKNLQSKMDSLDESPEFAIGIFDCDNLKAINDNHGHQEGNSYIKSTASLICQVFHHSPVFRLGGDEFAVILMDNDYRKRAELISAFEEKSNEIRKTATEDWEKVSVSLGIADYNPDNDKSVSDVVRRADEQMYKNKRDKKATKE